MEKAGGGGKAKGQDVSQGARAGRENGLKPGEALESLLSYAVRQDEVRGAASGLMKRFKGMRGVLDASAEELAGSGHLSESGAVLLKLVKETAALYLKERMMGVDAVLHKKAVLDYLTLTLSGERIEKFIAIYLNHRNEVLSVEVLHEGTINQTVVYPRKAIERAFAHQAAAVVFVHNHPSGDSTPSGMDRQLARTLENAASAVDLKVLDHIVIGKNSYFSARESGWM